MSVNRLVRGTTGVIHDWAIGTVQRKYPRRKMVLAAVAVDGSRCFMDSKDPTYTVVIRPQQ